MIFACFILAFLWLENRWKACSIISKKKFTSVYYCTIFRKFYLPSKDESPLAENIAAKNRNPFYFSLQWNFLLLFLLSLLLKWRLVEISLKGGKPTQENFLRTWNRTDVFFIWTKEMFTWKKKLRTVTASIWGKLS